MPPEEGSTYMFSTLPQQPIDIADLRLWEQSFEHAIKAEKTWWIYAQRWHMFTVWCKEAGQPVLPTTTDALRLYVTWALSKRRNRLNTVKITVNAIIDRHRREGYPSPVTKEIWGFVLTCARHLKEEPGGKKPLTLDHIKAICALPWKTPMERRDRAIILLGFACGWRRSELAGLEYRDMTFVEEGVVLRLRHSKTDQRGRGRQVGIHKGDMPETCPVRALRVWIEERGDEPGPLFLQTRRGVVVSQGISGTGIHKMLKRILRQIGVDPAAYGAHSLRAGFVTKAAELGASELSIMARTGHRSTAMVLRYVRPTQAFAENPLKGIL